MYSGNMWSQDWSNIYKQFQPYKNRTAIDVATALNEQVTVELVQIKKNND